MQRKYYTVGPTQLHPNYSQYYTEALNLNLGSTYHRSREFRALYQFTDQQLKILLGLNESHSIYFASGGTEIWERILMSLVAQKTFHLVNGHFGKKFFEFARTMHKEADLYEIARGTRFDWQNIYIPKDVELICLTQNETSTGYTHTLAEASHISKMADGALVCADAVSIAPLFHDGYSMYDSFFFSVQKAFGMPPGLGVWIVNEACKQKSEQLQSSSLYKSAYHTLADFELNYKKWETPSTPNVIAIYILGKIAEWMNMKGLSTIEHELNLKAELIYNFAKQSKAFSPLVDSPEHQSSTTLVLETKIPSCRIIQSLEENGLYISAGYGSFQENEIRIANFPQTTIEDTLTLLQCLKLVEEQELKKGFIR
jgi:phosphoserine aminotransferase